MNPANIIETALAAGILLAANDGQIELTAKQRPPALLLAHTRNHKPELLIKLERLQRLWLERVAHLLQSTPEHLLQNKLVEPLDLREQWHKEPRDGASLIRSCFRPEQYQSPAGGNQ